MRRKAYLLFITVWISVSAAQLHAQWTQMNPVKGVQKETDGVVFSMGTGTLKLQVCSDSVIRVLYSPTSVFPKKTDYVVIKESWPAAKWTMDSSSDAITLSTSLLKITVTKKDLAPSVRFRVRAMLATRVLACHRLQCADVR